MKQWIIVGALGVVLVGGMLIWVSTDQSDDVVTSDDSTSLAEPVSKTAPEVIVEPASLEEQASLGERERVAPEPVEKLEPIMPAPKDLNNSDSQVVEVFMSLSPNMVEWLATEELVRKWVLAVDLLADGKLPQRHKPLVFEVPEFKVQALNSGAQVERYQPLASNSDRVTPLIQAVALIPPKTAGRYYRAWLPVFEQAYAELGKSGSFKSRVDSAVKAILAVPSAPPGAELSRPHVFYEYADPVLEARSPLEKGIWRIGEGNREVLQAYFKELRFYL